MKITHVNPALTKGGAEKVLVDLSNLAVARGHDVSIVSAFAVDPALLQDQIDPRVKLHFIRPIGSSKLSAYAAMLPWLLGNWSWLKQQDVIHCHMTYGALLGTAITLRRLMSGHKKPRIVETFHGVGMPIRPWQRSVAAMQANFRDAYALMAVDEYWGNFAKSHPRLPLAIIPNGIAVDQHAPSAFERNKYRQDAGIPEGAPVVGTIGRLRAERNPLAIVAAFAEARKHLGPQTHYLMAGDGPMTEAVRTEAERLGFADTLHLPGLAIKPWVACACIDLYVSINVGPTTGIAGLEAASAGIPVIALQATSDYAKGDRDWIWSHPDPAKVGAEVARLMLAPALRAEMGSRQAEHVRQHFSASTMLESYMKLYAAAQP